MLHKLALNIIRTNKRESKSKAALNGIMFQCLMNPCVLLRILGKIDFRGQRALPLDIPIWCVIHFLPYETSYYFLACVVTATLL